MSKTSKRMKSVKKRNERRAAKHARMTHKALEKTQKDNLSIRKARARGPEPRNVGDYKVYEKELLPGLARILLAEYRTGKRQYTSGYPRAKVRDYIILNMNLVKTDVGLYYKVRQKQIDYPS